MNGNALITRQKYQNCSFREPMVDISRCSAPLRFLLQTIDVLDGEEGRWYAAVYYAGEIGKHSTCLSGLQLYLSTFRQQYCLKRSLHYQKYKHLLFWHDSLHLLMIMVSIVQYY